MQQTSPQAYLIIQFAGRWTDVLCLQRQPIIVGRSSDNQIVVHDERVSRQHAAVEPLSGGWQVRDLGSRNGTQLNDITLDQPHELNEGETIGVGGCRITFCTSLNAGFTANRRLNEASPGDGAESEPRGQATVEIESLPLIVQRRHRSQWSGELLATAPPGSSTAASPAGTRLSSSERWGFFYQLVFDLVQCRTRASASQLALDRLLEHLGIASGGVVWLSQPALAGDATAPQSPRAQSQRVEPLPTNNTATALPAMVVLATRQPDGESYRRISDFLVTTLLRDGQAILARNVMDDSHLSLARQSARRGVVSLICAPLRQRVQGQEHLIGILHVYSAGEERMLTDVDLEVAVAVADNLTLALSQHAANEQLERSLATSRRQIDQLQSQLEISTELIGRSSALQRVRSEISRAAPTSATILIRGESGVGKELVARAIHRLSLRRDGPLICLNCAALAPTLLESELFGHERGAFTGATERKLGKFEAADGGTLLLDEIGEMPSELQAKFLRVLEGQPFERLGGNKSIQTDVRVIAATNRDLEEAIAEKSFRADLYYRLRVVELTVAPLRQRPDDIPPLVEFFIEQLRQHAGRRLEGIEPEAMELLTRHSWPGNVRELRNVLERAIVLGCDPTLGIEDLKLSTFSERLTGDPSEGTNDSQSVPQQPLTDSPFEPLPLSELERRHILAMLAHCGGNKSQAARQLGIERSTLDRKLKRF